MKTSLALIGFIITAFLFASCTKPRTCTCTDQYGGTTNATITSNKKTAKEWCDNIQATSGSGVTCALD